VRLGRCIDQALTCDDGSNRCDLSRGEECRSLRYERHQRVFPSSVTIGCAEPFTITRMVRMMRPLSMNCRALSSCDRASSLSPRNESIERPSRFVDFLRRPLAPLSGMVFFFFDQRTNPLRARTPPPFCWMTRITVKCPAGKTGVGPMWFLSSPSRSPRKAVVRFLRRRRFGRLASRAEHRSAPQQA